MNTIPGTTIPGTKYPFPVPNRKGLPPLRNEAEARQRRGLLAKIHIAKQEMRLNAGEYEAILAGFKVASAADMTIPQLENMVKYLKYLGWKPSRLRKKQDPDRRERLDALRKRVIEEVRELPGWEKRLPGLTKAICGVAPLAWVDSAAKLKRLLVVISSIKERELQKEE